MAGVKSPKSGPVQCRRCGDSFRRRVGPQYYCDSCRRLAKVEYQRRYHRLHYMMNREIIKARAREYEKGHLERTRASKRKSAARRARMIRNQVLGHYSNWSFTCACCGESEREFLTIDHAAGNGNRMSRDLGIPRAGTGLTFWLFRNGLPTGFQVMCMNCNSSKWKHGECVHKSNGVAGGSAAPVARTSPN